MTRTLVAALLGLTVACSSSPPAKDATAIPEPPPAGELGEVDPSAADADLRARECAMLVNVINRGVDRLREGSEPGGDTEDELRVAIERMKALEHEAAALDLTLVELDDLRDHYQVMLQRTIRALSGLADAIETEDLDSVQEHIDEMDAAVASEDGIVDDVNFYCAERKNPMKL